MPLRSVTSSHDTEKFFFYIWKTLIDNCEMSCIRTKVLSTKMWLHSKLKAKFLLVKKDGFFYNPDFLFYRVSLKARTFNNENFYRAHQDNLTPAGLAIFQSVWDSSVTELFHNQLKSVEPIFEYDNDPPHHPKQEWFPLGKPFDLWVFNILFFLLFTLDLEFFDTKCFKLASSQEYQD